MTQKISLEDIKEHLQYEVRFLLGAHLLVRATLSDGNIQNYFKDSAYIHVRNLYEFLTKDNKSGKGFDVHLTDLGCSKLHSAVYAKWSEALNRRTAHLSPGRLGRNDSKEPIGSEQLNEQVDNFCKDIEYLWLQWSNSDNSRSEEIMKIWHDAKNQADADESDFKQRWLNGMTGANNEQQKITFSATPLDHKDIHDKVGQIISDKLQDGIGDSRKEWQDFLSTPLRKYSQFSEKNIDQSARLIEMISLDVVTGYLNDINNGKLTYAPAFLPQQSDQNLIPLLGKDSCDGLMFETNGRNPSPVFIEQKSSMRDPNDSTEIGDINDYFEDWINNLLTSVKGDRLLWVFNVMPYSDDTSESRNPLDLNKVIDLIHAKKKDIFAGVVCFYTHPDESTLEVTCAPIRQADLSNNKNPDEVKRMRYKI